MRFLVLVKFTLPILFVGFFSAAKADVLEDYSLGWDRGKLKSYGAKVQVSQGVERFTIDDPKKEKTLVIHDKNNQTVFTEAQWEGKKYRQLVEYSSDEERALNRTLCVNDGKSSKYSCRTQSHIMCRSYIYNLGESLFGGNGELDQLKKCDTILRNLQTDAKAIQKTQQFHLKSLSETLKVPESELVMEKPSEFPSLKELVADISRCQQFDSGVFGSRWAYDDVPVAKKPKSGAGTGKASSGAQ